MKELAFDRIENRCGLAPRVVVNVPARFQTHDMDSTILHQKILPLRNKRMLDATLEKKVNTTGINFLNFGDATPRPDSDSKVTGTGDGWGYNLGFLFKPAEQHKIGVSYKLHSIESSCHGRRVCVRTHGPRPERRS